MTEEQYSIAENIINPNDIKPVKPAFGYYGAKQRISSSIIALLPPHNAWVEVFCGSAAITLAKPPAQIEIINDLDNTIVNLFNQLRNNTEQLINSIELTPYSREEFQLAKIRNDNDSELEQARKFLILSMMTVNATIGNHNCGLSYSNSYSRNGVEARVNRWNNLPERISKVVKRLKNIRVENKDAIDIVKMFSDRPATLMYLDPPYFVKRSHDYPVDQKEREFHEKLLKYCCSSKAMMLVSHYDNELYQTYLGKTGWKRKIIKTTTRNTKGKDSARKEVLWMNSAFVKAKADNKVLITLSESEVLNKKINPSRK